MSSNPYADFNFSYDDYKAYINPIPNNRLEGLYGTYNADRSMQSHLSHTDRYNQAEPYEHRSNLRQIQDFREESYRKTSRYSDAGPVENRSNKSQFNDFKDQSYGDKRIVRKKTYGNRNSSSDKHRQYPMQENPDLPVNITNSTRDVQVRDRHSYHDIRENGFVNSHQRPDFNLGHNTIESMMSQEINRSIQRDVNIFVQQEFSRSAPNKLSYQSASKGDNKQHNVHKGKGYRARQRKNRMQKNNLAQGQEHGNSNNNCSQVDVLSAKSNQNIHRLYSNQQKMTEDESIAQDINRFVEKNPVNSSFFNQEKVSEENKIGQDIRNFVQNKPAFQLVSNQQVISAERKNAQGIENFSQKHSVHKSSNFDNSNKQQNTQLNLGRKRTRSRRNRNNSNPTQKQDIQQQRPNMGTSLDSSKKMKHEEHLTINLAQPNTDPKNAPNSKMVSQSKIDSNKVTRNKDTKSVLNRNIWLCDDDDLDDLFNNVNQDDDHDDDDVEVAEDEDDEVAKDEASHNDIVEESVDEADDVKTVEGEEDLLNDEATLKGKILSRKGIDKRTRDEYYDFVKARIYACLGDCKYCATSWNSINMHMGHKCNKYNRGLLPRSMKLTSNKKAIQLLDTESFVYSRGKDSAKINARMRLIKDFDFFTNYVDKVKPENVNEEVLVKVLKRFYARHVGKWLMNDRTMMTTGWKKARAKYKEYAMLHLTKSCLWNKSWEDYNVGTWEEFIKKHGIKIPKSNPKLNPNNINSSCRELRNLLDIELISTETNNKDPTTFNDKDRSNEKEDSCDEGDAADVNKEKEASYACLIGKCPYTFNHWPKAKRHIMNNCKRIDVQSEKKQEAKKQESLEKATSIGSSTGSFACLVDGCSSVRTTWTELKAHLISCHLIRANQFKKKQVRLQSLAKAKERSQSL